MLFVALILIVFTFSFVIADDNSSEDNSSVSVEEESVSSDDSDETEEDSNSDDEEENEEVNPRRPPQERINRELRERDDLRERVEINENQRARIVRAENMLKRFDETGECPENCECEEEAIKCQIETDEGVIKELIIHERDSGDTVIRSRNFNASTNVTLYKSEDGKLYGVFKNNETKRIILPDEVRERIKERIRAHLENESINLSEDGNYKVEAKKRAKLFFIFNVKEKINAEVDAETGEVIRTRGPWWGFLARDVKDDSEVESEEDEDDSDEEENETNSSE